MRNTRASLIVGLVLIGGVAAFIAMYSVTERDYTDDKGSYQVWALFEDVTGLGPRTRVTIAGVQVGEIVDVQISEEHPSMARVTLKVRGDITLHAGRVLGDQVVNGATLTRKSASLLGNQYLELTRGVAGAVLQDGDRIPTAVSVSGMDAVLKEMQRAGSLVDRVDDILIKVDGIAGDIKAVTGSASTILGGPDGERRISVVADNVEKASEDLSLALGEVRRFSEDLRGFLGESVLGRGDQVGRIITNVERFSENAAALSGIANRSAEQILADVKVVTGDIRSMISGSRGDVESSIGTIKGTLASLQRTLNKLDRAIDNVESITGKIDEGEGTLGKLVNDDKVIDKVEETVTEAGDFIRQVTGLRARVEISSEYYFEQQALKNYVRLRLQPQEDKYYLFEVVDDPRGSTNTSTVVKQTNDPSLPPVLSETITTTSDDLKFSFMFAKRWYFLTARFGILESTGGLGLDAELFQDALKMTVDMFDFTAGDSPRMRVLASWTFLKHIQLRGGVDDVFNSDTFDWFLGIGIRFTDADLKGLLTVAPTPSL